MENKPMNYELAKKLKDAGFPQTFDKETGRSFFLFPDGYTDKDGRTYKKVLFHEHSTLVKIPDDGVAAKYPTLSELIEACGMGIHRLWRVEGGGWCATGTNDFNDGLGSTPEEAVANLWIALNEKKV